MNSAVVSAGRGRGWQRLPRTLVRSYVVPTHVPSAQDTSVTTHCHAATAQLTREYQGDHRRYVLTPATTCAGHPLPERMLVRSARGSSAGALLRFASPLRVTAELHFANHLETRGGRKAGC
jgi:hypothetical protein